MPPRRAGFHRASSSAGVERGGAECSAEASSMPLGKSRADEQKRAGSGYGAGALILLDDQREEGEEAAAAAEAVMGRTAGERAERNTGGWTDRAVDDNDSNTDDGNGDDNDEDSEESASLIIRRRLAADLIVRRLQSAQARRLMQERRDRTLQRRNWFMCANAVACIVAAILLLEDNRKDPARGTSVTLRIFICVLSFVHAVQIVDCFLIMMRFKTRKYLRHTLPTMPVSAQKKLPNLLPAQTQLPYASTTSNTTTDNEVLPLLTDVDDDLGEVSRNGRAFVSASSQHLQFDAFASPRSRLQEAHLTRFFQRPNMGLLRVDWMLFWGSDAKYQLLVEMLLVLAAPAAAFVFAIIKRTAVDSTSHIFLLAWKNSAADHFWLLLLFRLWWGLKCIRDASQLYRNRARVKTEAYRASKFDPGAAKVLATPDFNTSFALKFVISQHMLGFVFVYAAFWTMLGGYMIYLFERAPCAPPSETDVVCFTFPNGVWLAFECLVTAYASDTFGVLNPRTWGGKITSVCVVIAGLGLFAILLETIHQRSVPTDFQRTALQFLERSVVRERGQKRAAKVIQTAWRLHMYCNSSPRPVGPTVRSSFSAREREQKRQQEKSRKHRVRELARRAEFARRQFRSFMKDIANEGHVDAFGHVEENHTSAISAVALNPEPLQDRACNHADLQEEISELRKDMATILSLLRAQQESE